MKSCSDLSSSQPLQPIVNCFSLRFVHKYGHKYVICFVHVLYMFILCFMSRIDIGIIVSEF